MRLWGTRRDTGCRCNVGKIHSPPGAMGVTNWGSRSPELGAACSWDDPGQRSLNCVSQRNNLVPDDPLLKDESWPNQTGPLIDTNQIHDSNQVQGANQSTERSRGGLSLGLISNFYLTLLRQ